MTASKATKKKQAAKQQRRRDKARRVAEARNKPGIVPITDNRPAALAAIRALLEERRPPALPNDFVEEKREGHIDWTEALRDKPVDDVLDGLDLGTWFGLSEGVEVVVGLLADGTFQQWEAVLRAEQDLPLTEAHAEAFDGLMSFSDDEDDDRVLYIADRARACEPWYATVRRLAPRLVVEGVDTTGTHPDELLTMGERLVDAVVEHAKGLSLPPGCDTPVDVFPAALAHRLRVQAACQELQGIGQVFRDGRRNPLRHHATWFQEALAERVESLRSTGRSTTCSAS